MSPRVQRGHGTQRSPVLLRKDQFTLECIKVATFSCTTETDTVQIKLRMPFGWGDTFLSNETHQNQIKNDCTENFTTDIHSSVITQS
jgi:hypothetical protein